MMPGLNNEAYGVVMSKLISRIGCVLLLGVVSTSAFASIITDSKNPYRFLREGQSHTVTHDLTDDGVPTDYSVTGARLHLGFSDGYFVGDWAKDIAGITGAGISGTFEVDGTHYFGYDIRTLGVGPGGIASLNMNGLLQVTVTALKTPGRWDGHNDFWWKTSLLKAKVEAVPEPGTLGLLGLGLLGLAFARRTRTS